MKKRNDGFSLVELIIVMTILAIMGGILVGSTGNIRAYKIKQYTEILDSFMKKTRTDAMAKNHISGFCIYEKNNRYYVESYGEVAAEGGATAYKTVEVREIGAESGIKISISKKDGTSPVFLENNEGDVLTSYIRVRYATGTGIITHIMVDTDSVSMIDATKITISKGDTSQCIEMNPATGRHSQN